MKRIVLCADDYGQAEAITQGILSLLEKKRLSAVSCLVNTQQWLAHAKRLMPYAKQIDLGLHFNLTEGKALSNCYIETHGPQFMPLNALLGKAFTGKLNKPAIEAELNAQIDAFTGAMGFLPNFIDGHQHVQQFPTVRQALIDVYNARLRAQNTYVRLVTEKLNPSDVLKNFKKLIILFSGANALKKLLTKHQIHHNESFAGIYSFKHAQEYEFLFQGFLRNISDRGIIMCHPGLLSFSDGDTIAKARYEEYQYISSSKFLEDCQRYRIVLKPFLHF